MAGYQLFHTNRTQTFNPDAFTNKGCDFAKQRILIVKSTNHFYPAFAKIASEVLYVDTGLTMGSPYPSDPSKTPFTKITRAIWCACRSASLTCYNAFLQNETSLSMRTSVCVALSDVRPRVDDPHGIASKHVPWVGSGSRRGGGCRGGGSDFESVVASIVFSLRSNGTL